jgi:hypothetical protein
MSMAKGELRRAVRLALLACLVGSCAPASPRITVYFRIDDEQFRPEYLLVTWQAPDGKDQSGIRIPKDGDLDVVSPLLGSLVVDMADAPAGDRTVIAWGMKGLVQVSGARATVQWEPGSRRDVSLTLGCVQTATGPPVEGEVSRAPWLACKPPEVDAAGEPPDAGADPSDASPGEPGADAGSVDVAQDGGAAAAVDAGSSDGHPELAIDVRPPDARPDLAADRGPDALPAGADLGKGLVAYYRFDDPVGSATAHDSSGNSLTATLRVLDPNSAWVPGHLGGALDVSAKGWASVDSSPLLNTLVEAFTFSAWINRSGDGTVVSRRYVGANGFLFRLFVTGGKLGLQINSSSGANANVVGPAVPPGTWVHVAARYDHLSASVYLSGAPAGSVPYSVSLPSETSPLELGANQDATLVSADERFAGQLDELAVYNRALSEAEIGALAAGNLPPAK